MGLNPAQTRSFHAYRLCTVHGNELYEPMRPLEALICLWGAANYSTQVPNAQRYRQRPSGGVPRAVGVLSAYGVPANLFSYGSFPLDCPRGITGCR